MEIKNETVYVIYHDGEPFDGNGRKSVYTKKGAARGVITEESKDIAKNRNRKDWYEFSREDQEQLINNVKSEFEIVEYVPKYKK